MPQRSKQFLLINEKKMAEVAVQIKITLGIGCATKDEKDEQKEQAIISSNLPKMLQIIREKRMWKNIK